VSAAQNGDTVLGNENGPAIGRPMRALLVKHFTPDELKAQAVFYGSPLGKSVMSKSAAFSADMMPTMLAAIMRAAMLTLTASRSAKAEAWSEAGNANPDETQKLEALRQQAGKKARWACRTRLF
jgi:hypothetical protein